MADFNIPDHSKKTKPVSKDSQAKVIGNDKDNIIVASGQFASKPVVNFDGKGGNDKLVVNMATIPGTRTFNVNGIESLVLQLNSEFKLTPNVFKPKQKGVAPEDQVFHMIMGDKTFVFKSSEVQNVTVEFNGQQQTLLKSDGSKLFFIDRANPDNPTQLDVEGSIFRRRLLTSSIGSASTSTSDLTNLQKPDKGTLTKG